MSSIYKRKIQSDINRIKEWSGAEERSTLPGIEYVIKWHLIAIKLAAEGMQIKDVVEFMTTRYSCSKSAIYRALAIDSREKIEDILYLFEVSNYAELYGYDKELIKKWLYERLNNAKKELIDRENIGSIFVIGYILNEYEQSVLFVGDNNRFYRGSVRDNYHIHTDDKLSDLDVYSEIELVPKEDIGQLVCYFDIHGYIKDESVSAFLQNLQCQFDTIQFFVKEESCTLNSNFRFLVAKHYFPMMFEERNLLCDYDDSSRIDDLE